MCIMHLFWNSFPMLDTGDTVHELLLLFRLIDLWISFFMALNIIWRTPALSRRIDRFKLGFQVKFAALALQVESTWINGEIKVDTWKIYRNS